jgi:Polysaccharide deacetylase
MEKNAIITFDYEVFLGRKTGTIENCVIKPTRLILELLKKNNAKAIFFVDATWLLFLKVYFPTDLNLVTDQLKSIVELGSSVELHLHPQWLNASNTGSRIVFNSYEKYKLHSLSSEEILDLFNRSIELLESITTKKVRCFRAGGWCIEPFNKISDVFEASGIVYDFSVLPGMSLKEGEVYDYDFSRAPKLQFYKFQNDVNEPDEKGCFVEFPLSTYKNNPAYRILNKLLLKLNKDFTFGDGIGSKEKSFSRTLFQLFRLSTGMLTLDKTSNPVFRYLLQTHFRQSAFLVIVSHPKTISEQALKNLSYVVKKYKTHNSEELDKLLLK